MLTSDDRADLYEQAQDVVLTASILSGLYQELKPNAAWDEFVAEVGKEVYELVVKRIEQRQDELESVKETT